MKDQIKFIVIQGNGRAFCAGGDIKPFLKLYEKQDKETVEELD